MLFSSKAKIWGWRHWSITVSVSAQKWLKIFGFCRLRLIAHCLWETASQKITSSRWKNRIEPNTKQRKTTGGLNFDAQNSFHIQIDMHSFTEVLGISSAKQAPWKHSLVEIHRNDRTVSPIQSLFREPFELNQKRSIRASTKWLRLDWSLIWSYPNDKVLGRYEGVKWESLTIQCLPIFGYHSAISTEFSVHSPIGFSWPEATMPYVAPWHRWEVRDGSSKHHESVVIVFLIAIRFLEDCQRVVIVCFGKHCAIGFYEEIYFILTSNFRIQISAQRLRQNFLVASFQTPHRWIKGFSL